MNQHIKEQIEKMNQQVKELAYLYHNAASKSGISDNEFWVWYALLVLEGEYSQQDICDIWSLPKQTINSIVANLSKKGFLVLENVPGTRNRKIIRLTEDGKKYGNDVVMQVYQAEQRSLERMTEEERQIYISLMDKYITILKDEICEKHGTPASSDSKK